MGMDEAPNRYYLDCLRKVAMRPIPAAIQGALARLKRVTRSGEVPSYFGRRDEDEQKLHKPYPYVVLLTPTRSSAKQECSRDLGEGLIYDVMIVEATSSLPY